LGRRRGQVQEDAEKKDPGCRKEGLKMTSDRQDMIRDSNLASIIRWGLWLQVLEENWVENMPEKRSQE